MPDAIKDIVTYFTWRPTVCVAPGTVCRFPGTHKHNIFFSRLSMLHQFKRSIISCRPLGEASKRCATRVCVPLYDGLRGAAATMQHDAASAQQRAWVAPEISGLKPEHSNFWHTTGSRRNAGFGVFCMATWMCIILCIRSDGWFFMRQPSSIPLGYLEIFQAQNDPKRTSKPQQCPCCPSKPFGSCTPWGVW